MRGFILAVTGLGLVACTAPETVSKPAGTPWQFETHESALRAASCPEGVGFERAISLPISVTEIDRGTPDQQARALKGMSFSGAWHLTADNPNFGGLSGLAVMPSGSLLAINDAGVWVWIGIDSETGAPDGIGSIANMRAADGNFFARKQAGDSEGLAFRDGLALVSFEQQHRIEAFDLEGCGTAARAARVV
ncbi:MAG: esterase-like activity of phytase family protein, partial [Henriciella sp.]|nr:esterase-like activity of phytase family protein [Henriciella sp.]